MTDYFSSLAPARVFVPLCGKSLDLKWLLEHGHEVIGVELSELACREFYREHSIPFRESQCGRFTVFRGERITVLNGDFFELEPSSLLQFGGQIGAVYDRAALIAMPPDIRARYARHMIQLLQGAGRDENFRFLQIVLERTPHDEKGPPFSVCLSEIESLYGAYFKIRALSREQLEEATSECVYELYPR